MIKFLRAVGPLLVALALLWSPAYADGPVGQYDQDHHLPAVLENARFDQRLGEQAPLDLTFRDEAGQPVRLADYFGDKPVLLTLNYYHCDNLCPLVLDGVVRGLKPVPFSIGNEFNVVTVSIDPDETPELASEVERRILKRYDREGAVDGWAFLTGEQAAIDRLAEAVGFNFAWDEESQQFAHPSGAIFLSPDGTIARYIYGIEFSPRDLRLALVEASEKRIASPVDHVLLFCFRYDPTTGQYGAIAINSMRLAGAATVLVLGAAVVALRRREEQEPPTAPPPAPAPSGD